MTFVVVAIGRNEGERLKRCIKSVSLAKSVVYVDSGSTDGSVQWARESGVEVIELDGSVPFTAARARNAGLRRLQEAVPNLSFVQFVDGDCELNEGWFQQALCFLNLHPNVPLFPGAFVNAFPKDRSTIGCAIENGIAP
jgi:glycosyltransferase involved in cell wall biosynthesis